MREKDDITFKWIPAVTLLHKVRNANGCFGRYCIAKSSDDGQVILDRVNLKMLVSSSNKEYTVSPNWIGWLKRGFFVVKFQEVGSRYYIIKAKSNRVVVSGSYIYNSEEFTNGESDYFIVYDGQQGQAIFNKNGKRISDWFDDIYLVDKKEGPTYYKARRGKGRAIFLMNGKQISDWAESFETSSGWFVGKSDYFVASRKKGYEKAIFRKDGRMISDWRPEDKIYCESLVDGKSDYFMIEHKGKYTIFNKDGFRITDWFSWINPTGLVQGQSNYYIARKRGKEAIFHKNGQQVIGWFEVVYPNGLVEGKSDYYVARDRGKVYIGKLGSPKLLGPYKDFVFWDQASIISNPVGTSITVHTLDNRTLNISKTDVEQFFEEIEEKYE
jgi:hypothetical protein